PGVAPLLLDPQAVGGRRLARAAREGGSGEHGGPGHDQCEQASHGVISRPRCGWIEGTTHPTRCERRVREGFRWGARSPAGPAPPPPPPPPRRAVILFPDSSYRLDG